MIHNSKFNNGGFTLVEILVALGLFSLVISITVGIFVSGSGSQRKIIELYTVQREANYIMETISRELRMAKAIDTSQQNSENSEIEFTNYEDNLITYCKSDEYGNCDDVNGEYFSRDGRRISSSDIIIEDLIFYTSDTFNLTQPLITIVLKVKSRGKYGTSIFLQNSTSLRIYN